MTTTDKHAYNTVSWFDLMSPEPAKARDFYAGLFGWTYQIGGPEMGNYSMAQVAGKNAAGIGQPPPSSTMPSVWTAYWNVESADATAKSIVDHGGTIMMPVMDVMDAGRMAIAIDPTGAAFGLWQPGRHTGAQVVSQHGAMGWQECHTRDGAKAQDFYARVFKLEPVKVEGMEYWLLQRGPTHLGGVDHDMKMPAHVPPHWLVYFDVDNADACVAKIAATGGKVLMPAFDTPHGRMAVAADPFGAAFAVIQPPKQ